MIRNRLRYFDWIIAIFLLVATSTVLGFAQRKVGIPRDEGIYFVSSEKNIRWWEGMVRQIGDRGPNTFLSERSIAAFWKLNAEHPALMKDLFGLSWRLFHDPVCITRNTTIPAPACYQDIHTLGLLDETSAFRLPSWLLAGLTVMLLYIFGFQVEGRVAGLVAALSYITIPRVFFHAQLACFDNGVTALYLLVVYAYLRSLSSMRWGIALGVLWGLAISAKHNALFLPIILGIHYLIVVWPDVSLRPFRLPRIPLGFVAMAVLGPLIFLATWPWLWFDTIAHLEFYFHFHLDYAYYNVEYLGTNYNNPPLPISYPFVMMLFTVPTTFLVLALGGMALSLGQPVAWLRARWRGGLPPAPPPGTDLPVRRSFLRPAAGLPVRLGLLVGVNAFFPLVLIALPSTPISGGTKHFITGYPFFAIFAGIAVSRLVAALAERRWLAVASAWALPVLVALPGAVNTYETHPYGLSQYNALAGGPAGGADMGLMRQFWGYSPRALLPWMNATFKKDARLYLHDIIGYSHNAYIREGHLRPDIRDAGVERPGIDRSDYALVIHELHFNKYEYWIWDAYQTVAPIAVLTTDDGVPIVTVYGRK